MKNIAIIYHDADFDGIASNEVCRYHLRKLWPDAAIHSYGWDYGRPAPLPIVSQQPTDVGCPTAQGDGLLEWRFWDAIYIVDLSVDELMVRPELHGKIVWIDHHKSAIEKWDKYEAVDGECHPDNPVATRAVFAGLRIDGVAACRLCWHWFQNIEGRQAPAPVKEWFVNRTVSEPRVIRLLGEYDVWDRRDDDADVLQYGLRTCVNPATTIQNLLSACDINARLLNGILLDGRNARNYARTVDAQNARATYLRTLFDIPMIVLNGRGNSKTFDSALERFPEASALCMWYFDGDKVKVSLYHMRDRTDIDLSVFAKEMGGGGHRGACGFTVPIDSLWFNEELT